MTLDRMKSGTYRATLAESGGVLLYFAVVGFSEWLTVSPLDVIYGSGWNPRKIAAGQQLQLRVKSLGAEHRRMVSIRALEA